MISLENFIPQKGYVYLMRYKYTNKYKIGWSADPYVRAAYIRKGDDKNEGLKGVRVIKFVKVWWPETAEDWLHKKWESENFIFRGSGKTEWFRFNVWELMFLEFDFMWVVIWEWVQIIGWTTLGLSALIGFICFLL